MTVRSCVGPHMWYRPDHTETFCSECGDIRKPWHGAAPNPDPLRVEEPRLPAPFRARMDPDRSAGITIPLLLAIVVVVAAVVALAMWGGTR